MFRTQDVQFVSYLTAMKVRWDTIEYDTRGRVDFVFDLTRDEATQHRVNFANSQSKDYAVAYDLVMKVIQDAKRNRR